MRSLESRLRKTPTGRKSKDKIPEVAPPADMSDKRYKQYPRIIWESGIGK